MKYYVVSDVHGFYTPLITALQEKGFFNDSEPHKLIVCGDLFDRGKEALKLQDFILDLMKKDEVILVRGNHEDLMLDFIDELRNSIGTDILFSHHASNGTISTATQLVKKGRGWIVENPDAFADMVSRSAFVKNIIPSTKNYFETTHYIFVHGWIPCAIEEPSPRLELRNFKFNPDWRNATGVDWERARWLNGMDLAHYRKILEPDKTIVCGHWHSSYGHYRFGGDHSEFGRNADFSPYYEDGIIAIDACTVESGIVNCLVIED